MTSTLDKVHKLYQYFQDGLIPTLAVHEVHPDLSLGARENYLYFTLPPCLNFQRSSPAMWAAALATYNDPQTNYLFFPEVVVTTEFAKIQADLVKHKLALQKNKHPLIWLAISKALHKFNSDPRQMLRDNDYDVVKILQTITNHKTDFPYLSGPKMSNYWLYILSQYTDAKFKNMHEISIIPDTHVLQSTMQLGMTPNVTTPEIANKLWKELLRDSKITPVEMHPVLWNWSRNNFQPAV